MNKEEFINVTNEKILELSNYIHNSDFSATEKSNRRFELAMSLFMASIAMNTEEIAKRELAHRLLILISVAEETIETNFHGTEPKGCKIRKMNEYKEKR